MGGLLEDKVAVVTGGASGLGRATVELFAEHGAKVVIADVHDDRGIETAKAAKALGGQACYLHTDVTASGDVRAAVQLAEDTYGKLDIMVANAGIAGPLKQLADIEDDEMAHAFDVNFMGIWRAFKYAVPAIRRAGGGSMSSTSSLAGLHTGVGATRGAYSSTKAAVNAMSSYFAVELAKDKIRVNCLCPGGMATNVVESYGLAPEELAAIKAALPEGRRKEEFGESAFPVCDPREVAQVHLFLNSSLGSFVSGQVIAADAAGYISTVASAFSKAVAMSADD